MGMFDNVQCKHSLPLTEDLQVLSPDWSLEVFQTKDLDNRLGSYTITEDGFLLEEVIEREYVPYTEEERAELKPKPWSVWKDVIEKNRYSKKIEHHGEVNFYNTFIYTEAEDYWLEFTAYFIYGKLDKILLLKAEKHTSQQFTNKLFDEKRLIEQSKPWNKLKRFLMPLGWRVFWRAMADLCYKASQVLSKLQFFIFRKML
jgi:hypothetical protein